MACEFRESGKYLSLRGRILLVSDDPVCTAVLAHGLVANGYEVASIGTAHDAKAFAARVSPALILLDMNLADSHGLGLCAEIRSMLAIPVIFITELTERRAGVAGLRAGADDVISKPFDPEDLRARLEAILRRYAPRPIKTVGPPAYEIGSLRISTQERSASLDSATVALTPIEYRLLKCFASHPGRAFSRAELSERVWGYRETPAGVHSIRRSVGFAKSFGEASALQRSSVYAESDTG